jgi:hypothetical protein
MHSATQSSVSSTVALFAIGLDVDPFFELWIHPDARSVVGVVADVGNDFPESAFGVDPENAAGSLPQLAGNGMTQSEGGQLLGPPEDEFGVAGSNPDQDVAVHWITCTDSDRYLHSVELLDDRLDRDLLLGFVKEDRIAGDRASESPEAFMFLCWRRLAIAAGRMDSMTSASKAPFVAR